MSKAPSLTVMPVSVPVSPAASQPVRVPRGATVEVRVDAMVVDEDTGAVTYPLVYLTEQQGPTSSMLGWPVSRVVPALVVVPTGLLMLSGDIACRAWVAVVASCGCNDPPGGCDCRKQKR